MLNEILWWEKTVEYKFIVDAHKKSKIDFAAPLAGVQEMAGDGVFSVDAKLILVEFKRDLGGLNSEKNKFVNYKKAKAHMLNRDNHHFLVYGCAPEGVFSLAARKYFSNFQIDDPLSILDMGIQSEQFIEYLRDLIKLKKEDKRSSGSVYPEFISSVVGISSGGASSISYSEYVRKAIPELYRELSITSNLGYKL